MAFDAAARGGGGGAGRGDAGSLLALTSQRVTALVQTMNQLDKLIDSMGSAADSPTLRARLTAAETKSDNLRVEVDGNLRRLRTEQAERPDPYASRSLEVLTEQYTDVRRRLAEMIRRSQAQQAAFPVPTVLNPLAEATRAAAAREGGDQVVTVEMQSMGLRALGDVDEAIAEERREAAVEIAQEAVAVKEAMQDISGLVNTQGEMLNKVEENVDTAHASTAAAVENVTIAAKLQKSYRIKCIFFFLLVLVLIAAVLIPVLIHVLPKKN